ncbi:Mannan endo-1 [Phytophthora citrophthora]|uniref:mannan endo-1,4-beta-mannosidase n=1 Tax=Phytophthora citrophthora TaxID=4793 RepID=A0AAD9LBT7_9STRA|nr:Mannan endo-1 [Phytophthora citrophthora]
MPRYPEETLCGFRRNRGRAAPGLIIAVQALKVNLKANPITVLGVEIQSSADLATIFHDQDERHQLLCRTWGASAGFVTTSGTSNDGSPFYIVYQLWKDGNATNGTRGFPRTWVCLFSTRQVKTGHHCVSYNGQWVNAFIHRALNLFLTDFHSIHGKQLGYFDNDVAAAKAAGVKLVVPFVNNSSDYGGMGECGRTSNVYVKQLGLKYHDDFYTNKKIARVQALRQDVPLMNAVALDLKKVALLPNSFRSLNIRENAWWRLEVTIYELRQDYNLAIKSIDYGTYHSVYQSAGFEPPWRLELILTRIWPLKALTIGTYHAYPDSWGVAESEHLAWGEEAMKLQGNPSCWKITALNLRTPRSTTLGVTEMVAHQTITFNLSRIYIKVLDSNHLVATGSEGFMNSDKSVYVYSGPSGVDFDQNLAIKSIDYGTYHAYPDSWGVAESEHLAWGEKWIKDHIASGKKAGKPVVLEEYGAKSQNAKVYNAWSDAVYAGASNMQYWDFGLASLKNYKDGLSLLHRALLLPPAIIAYG